MNSEMTPLERACVELVAKEHWPEFHIDGLRVTSRENTGVGRYVHMEDIHQQHLMNGVYETRERAVEMEGVKFGLDLAVAVQSSRIVHLELVTAGSGGWDGVEREWTIV